MDPSKEVAGEKQGMSHVTHMAWVYESCHTKDGLPAKNME